MHLCSHPQGWNCKDEGSWQQSDVPFFQNVKNCAPTTRKDGSKLASSLSRREALVTLPCTSQTVSKCWVSYVSCSVFPSSASRTRPSAEIQKGAPACVHDACPDERSCAKCTAWCQGSKFLGHHSDKWVCLKIGCP